MIKIIVGLPDSPNNERILDALSEKFLDQNVSAEFVSVYGKLGIEKTLAKDPGYNLLILNEELELASPVDAAFIDRLTDDYPSLGIVLIVKDERYQSTFLRRLFERNLYTVLLDKDSSVDQIVAVALAGRTKKEARMYYGLFADEQEPEGGHEAVLDDGAVNSALSHLERAVGDELDEAYGYVSGRFTDQQNLYLIGRMSDNLKERLANHLTYRRFVAMMNPIEQPNAPVGKEKAASKLQINLPSKTIVKKVVETVYAGAVVVGVGSVEAGIGSTYHAVMLASYLIGLGKQVGIIEFNDRPSLKMAAQTTESDFMLGKVRVRTCLTGEGVRMEGFEDVQYVILDLGELKRLNPESGIYEQTAGMSEMSRAHCQILIGSGAPWRIGRTALFNYNQQPYHKWNVLLFGAHPRAMPTLRSQLGGFFTRERIHASHYCPDPSDVTEEMGDVFNQCLERFAPEKPGNKLLSFMKRR